MSRTPLPAVPPDLAARGIVLRGRTDADGAFLRDLYLSTRWDEFAISGWEDAAKRDFLREQFRLQTLHYDAHYPGAAWGIVDVHGEAAGRLSLQLSGDDLRVIDFALMPVHRCRGIGGALMQAVQAQAPRLGAAAVSLHVEQGSRALGLYGRLGFRVVEDRGLHLRMTWPAAPTGKAGLPVARGSELSCRS